MLHLDTNSFQSSCWTEKVCDQVSAGPVSLPASRGCTCPRIWFLPWATGLAQVWPQDW